MSTDLATRFDAFEQGDYIELSTVDNKMDRRQLLVKFAPTLVGAFDESTNSWPNGQLDLNSPNRSTQSVYIACGYKQTRPQLAFEPARPSKNSRWDQSARNNRRNKTRLILFAGAAEQIGPFIGQLVMAA